MTLIERIDAYHQAIFEGDTGLARTKLLEVLHPPLPPLDDSDARCEFAAVRAKFGEYVSGLDRPLDGAGGRLQPTVTLDGRFTVEALRAVLAIMERVAPQPPG